MDQSVANDTTSQGYWQAGSLNGLFGNGVMGWLVEPIGKDVAEKCCLECCFFTPPVQPVERFDATRFRATLPERLGSCFARKSRSTVLLFFLPAQIRKWLRDCPCNNGVSTYCFVEVA